jgi:hypothetical protein
MNGQIKNLDGLVGKDTTKGSRNIKRLHKINCFLSDDLHRPRQERKEMDQHMDGCHTFHITDFKTYISRDGQEICQCISCGFTTPEAVMNFMQSSSKRTGVGSDQHPLSAPYVK